ncbi:hypothetical protein AB0E69_10085 [Kribbella sp. NPDC026611]|uniref:hypothetical protein n=1 Tax=Kribbella sp. NPDC026611 TaxID=3154911 RepID=UPI0033CD3137
MATTPRPEDMSLAAQLAMDLCATEAVLMLDRFERSLPADDPQTPLLVAQHLSGPLRELGFDRPEQPVRDLQPVPPVGPTRAQLLLVAAGELALEPEAGLTLEKAAARAGLDGRPAEELRATYDKYYGDGGVPAPGLRESLARTAEASILHRTAALGVKVRGNKQARDAAAGFVEQAQLVTTHRRFLDQHPAPSRAEQYADYLATGAKGIGVEALAAIAQLPQPVQTAVLAAAAAYMGRRWSQSYADFKEDRGMVGEAQKQQSLASWRLTTALDQSAAHRAGESSTRRDGLSR